MFKESKEEKAANTLIDWVIEHPELFERGKILDMLNGLRYNIQEEEK